MSRQTDSFLPSGAVASPPAFSPGSFLPPTHIPRSIPKLNFPFPNNNNKNNFISPAERPHIPPSKSGTRNTRPISPPKTRSTSAEETTAALVEDWRAYTAKLRSQHEGEKAHMMADRSRADEVMNDERELWAQERKILKDRIAELELENAKLRSTPTHTQKPSPPGLSRTTSYGNPTSYGPFGIASAGSNAMSPSSSLDGQAVPQESGRNADGTPFYAPAPQHPTRTFDRSASSELRVDDISAPGESPITVTSKSLTASDFSVQSPTGDATNDQPLSIPTPPSESVDISTINPSLEGIAIKTTAIAPSFVANVLTSQSSSPVKLSPNIKPPGRLALQKEVFGTLSRDDSNERQKGEKVDTKALLETPENTRLTKYAGHTPNHSVTNLNLLNSEHNSGTATPTQADEDALAHQSSCALFDGQSETDEDPELTGPLGITNGDEDEPFTLALRSRLLELERSTKNASPTTTDSSSAAADEAIEEIVKDPEMPTLKYKPSLNFGRPFGQK